MPSQLQSPEHILGIEVDLACSEYERVTLPENIEYAYFI
jgi:hypothetical protein